MSLNSTTVWYFYVLMNERRDFFIASLVGLSIVKNKVLSMCFLHLFLIRLFQQQIGIVLLCQNWAHPFSVVVQEMREKQIKRESHLPAFTFGQQTGILLAVSIKGKASERPRPLCCSKQLAIVRQTLNPIRTNRPAYMVQIKVEKNKYFRAQLL